MYIIDRYVISIELWLLTGDKHVDNRVNAYEVDCLIKC